MGGLMSEATISLPQFGPRETILLWIVLFSSVIALGYGLYLRRLVLRRDPGPDSMVRVATAIQEGAMAYLRRQLRTMLPFIVVVTAGLYLLYAPIYAQHPVLAVGVAGAFLLGCFASYGAGFVGMTSAVHGNVRVANAARRSYREALRTGFQAGTISGMFTVGLGLLGATIIFMAFKENAMRVLVGFGFGGSLVAAFMRVGGGIFTKAADVGADLVGKVEVGIPEDDPRNAAVIADNVGDNVGDCAGMAADLFESYEVMIVAAVILGGLAFGVKGIVFALLIQGLGILTAIIGILAVTPRSDTEHGMRAINRGFFLSAILAGGGVLGLAGLYLHAYKAFWAVLIGLGLASVIQLLTEHYTSTRRKPVQDIAEASLTGPATTVLSGLATGLESTVL